MALLDYHVLGDVLFLDHVPNEKMWSYVSRDRGLSRSVAMWTRGDMVYLRQDSTEGLIRRGFQNCPYDLNVYVVTDWVGGVVDRWGACEYVEGVLGREIVNPQAITFVMIGNVTGKQVLPFTPWIIAHRLLHAVQLSSGDISTNASSFQAGRMVRPVFGDMFSLDHVTDPIKIVGLLATCKSARDGQLNNYLDIDAELFAQYLITGRVRLMSEQEIWDHVVINSRGQFLDAQAAAKRVIINKGLRAFEPLVRELELRINQDLAQFVETLKGDVWAF